MFDSGAEEFSKEKSLLLMFCEELETGSDIKNYKKYTPVIKVEKKSLLDFANDSKFSTNEKKSGIICVDIKISNLSWINIVKKHYGYGASPNEKVNLNLKKVEFIRIINTNDLTESFVYILKKCKIVDFKFDLSKEIGIFYLSYGVENWTVFSYDDDGTKQGQRQVQIDLLQKIQSDQSDISEASKSNNKQNNSDDSKKASQSNSNLSQDDGLNKSTNNPKDSKDLNGKNDSDLNGKNDSDLNGKNDSDLNGKNDSESTKANHDHDKKDNTDDNIVSDSAPKSSVVYAPIDMGSNDADSNAPVASTYNGLDQSSLGNLTDTEQNIDDRFNYNDNTFDPFDKKTHLESQIKDIGGTVADSGVGAVGAIAAETLGSASSALAMTPFKIMKSIAKKSAIGIAVASAVLFVAKPVKRAVKGIIKAVKGLFTKKDKKSKDEKKHKKIKRNKIK